MSASRVNCSDYSQTIFKSRQIMLELMKSRGFDISDYEDFNMNEIHIMAQNKQLDMLLEKMNGNSFSLINIGHTKMLSQERIYIRGHMEKGK